MATKLIELNKFLKYRTSFTIAWRLQTFTVKEQASSCPDNNRHILIQLIIILTWSSDSYISISLFIQQVNHFSCFLKYKIILDRPVRNFLIKLHPVRDKHVFTYIRATLYKVYSIIQTLVRPKVAVKMQLDAWVFICIHRMNEFKFKDTGMIFFSRQLLPFLSQWIVRSALNVHIAYNAINILYERHARV